MDTSSPPRTQKRFSRRKESISSDLPDLAPVKSKSHFRPSTTDLDTHANVDLVRHRSSIKSVSSRVSFITHEKAQQGAFNFYNQLEEMLIQKVLTIEPQNRYDEEVLFIEKVFKNLPFFKELESQMDEESFSKLFKKIRLATYHPYEKICSDDGGGSESHVHIVISGRVEAQTLEYIAPSSRVLKRSTSPRKLFVKDGETQTKQLSKGDSFGGLISVKPEERRKVTIYVAQTETISAVIKYKDYLNIAGEAYAKKHSVNISFLSSLRIFHHWDHHRVTAFLRETEEIRFNRNQAIFKEADRGDLIYFIKDGEVELQKMMEFENKDRDESVDENLPVLKIGKISTTINKPKTVKKSIRLGIITKSDYFGESEFNETKPREYTAITYSSEVTLISIEKEKFKALMCDKVTTDIYKEQLLKKKKWRDGLLSKQITVRNSVVETNINNAASMSYLLNSPKYKQDDQSPKDLKASFFSFSNFGKKFDDPESSSIGSPDEIVAIKSPQYSDKPKKGKSLKAMETILKSPKTVSTPFINFTVVKNKKIHTSSRGLAFLRMNKSSDDTNPLYDKQIARLEKKLNQNRQKVESIILPGSKELDQSSKESPRFLGRKPDTPFIHLQGKSQSQGNLGKLSKNRIPQPPTIEFSPSPPQSPKMADNSDHGKAMIKLMKSLGLNRLYGGTAETSSPINSAFDIRAPSSPTFSSLAKDRISFGETGGIFRNSVTSNRSSRFLDAMNPIINISSPKIVPRTATASSAAATGGGRMRLSFKNKATNT